MQTSLTGKSAPRKGVGSKRTGSILGIRVDLSHSSTSCCFSLQDLASSISLTRNVKIPVNTKMFLEHSG